MEKIKALNVAIVGGGPGCKALMDMIFAEKLSQLSMKLIGVAYTNPAAVGYRFAREKGIYTTTDYHDLYKLKDLNMIIELTAREEVANEIARSKPEHVRFMDHEAARLFWDIFQIEEERIAERKRAEERIEHLNLVLRAIRNVNQLITRERDRDRLLKGACDRLIETRGYYNAWIALLDKSGGFVTSAEAGLGGDFLPMVEPLKRGELTDCGQRALSQSQVVVTKDPSSNCPDCPLSSMYGGRGGMTVRLEYGDKVDGILCASIPTDFTSDEEEQTLFNGVADDIAFAVYGIQLEQERNRAEEALQTAYDQSIIYAQELKEQIEEHNRAEKGKKKLEAQLLHAQKMESIGTLAGGVAHDFNNLLMGMQGYASLILNDLDETHPHYNWARRIEGQVESGAELTRQLLGFARGGKYDVKLTDINEIIKKSSSMFGRTKKEITIKEKYEQNPWTVEVDQGQIEQVLLNLYVNAWQAMPAGGYLYLETSNVTLDESSTKLYNAQPGRYVKISVTDTGTGMDEATQQMIFDPFFTTKERGWGTGLGLASAYGIMKSHGGIINVYSKKGHGSTFSIYLPAADTLLDGKEPAIRVEEIKRGTETILLVDDEQTIIDVGKELLSKLGYKVLSAARGQEALDVFKTNKDKIDMVILDMIMPVMSGGEVYNRIKEISPDMKVLLSSGYSIDGEATEILKRGCDGFIQKPFNMKELSRKIREIMET